MAGIPELSRPEGFTALAKRAVDTCERKLTDIFAANQPSLQLIQQVDDISDTLCQVLDVAELCRSTHADAAFREAADHTFNELVYYLEERMNTNPDLYIALRRVAEDAQLMASCTPEQSRMVSSLMAEFEGDGIHLDAAGRQQVIALKTHIGKLGTKLLQNASTPADDVVVAEQDLATAPPHVLAWHGLPTPDGRAQRSLPLPSELASALLPYFQGEARTKLEAKLAPATQRAAHSLQLLEELFASRWRLAKLIGFPSFACLAMRDKMVSSPDAVSSFLESLSEKMRPAAQQRVREIMQQSCDSELMLNARFTLDSAVAGLLRLSADLFDLRLQEHELQPGEGWAGHHAGLRKFVARQGADGPEVGVVFLDLFNRPGKVAISAHYVIRCGRVVPGGFQTPVVALCCNFANSGSEALSLRQLQVLLHEFGHAVHSLLSRTHFQHLSGTRAALDMVEFPSTLFEEFTFDERVMQHFLAVPLPLSDLRAGLQRARAARAATLALDMQELVALSLFDQAVHGARPLSAREVAHLYESVQERVCGTRGALKPLSKQSHLVHYAAAYYAYPQCYVLAGAVWKRLFEGQELSRAGALLREHVLRYGGAREPALLMQNLLGLSRLDVRDLIDDFLVDSGLAAR